MAETPFEANYSVERYHGPLSDSSYEFDIAETKTARPALSVESAMVEGAFKVSLTTGTTWIGRFRGGAEGTDGVFTTPNPDVVCIVVRGDGYWVPVHEPRSFEEVRAIPIKRVLPIGDPPALIFVTFTRLVAYGPRGLMWTTNDLSWDGLDILEAGSGRIRGTAWDSPGARKVPFLVDARSGETQGGAKPPTAGETRDSRPY